MSSETVSDNVETLINLALAEDFGSGDVTSTYFVPEHLTARAILTPRKKGVLSGVNVAAEVFRKVDPSLKVEVYLHDGEAVAPGAVVMLIEGSARSILGAEPHRPQLHPASFRSSYAHQTIRESRFPHQRPHPGYPQNHPRLPSAGKSGRRSWRRHQPPHGPL